MSDLRDLLGSLVAFDRDAAGAGAAGARLVAIGWATVDSERTIAGLGSAAVVGPEVAEPALGARAHVVRSGTVELVILEPITEGRLAAALARRGEGIAALYLDGDPGPAGRPGPLGRPQRLLAHARPWGPYLILVAPADEVGA